MTTREPDSARDVRRPLVGESFALQGSAALNDIFRLQYDQFLRFSRIRIGNVPDAEDLVQDAFLSVRRAYPDKGIGELRPLLFTALRNLTLDYLKSGYAKQRRSSAEIGDLHDVLACSRSATPETQVIDAQLLAIAKTAIAALEYILNGQPSDVRLALVPTFHDEALGNQLLLVAEKLLGDKSLAAGRPVQHSRRHPVAQQGGIGRPRTRAVGRRIPDL